MKNLLLVFGTRPEAIKMAPLINEIKKNTSFFEVKICVTAQHRQMLDQVLELFELKPDFDLDIMKDGQDLYDVTSKVLMGMRDILVKTNPDIVLVHGDTTTSTTTALAAFYSQIPVGHVEAGLRTKKKYNPWPEEMNRQLTSRLATFHFAPTLLNKNNLLNEGIEDESILITGNTVIDALHLILNQIESNINIEREIRKSLSSIGLKESNIDMWKENKRMILITGHRRESFGDGFLNICEALRTLVIKFPNVDFVYPMHLNPNVRGPIRQVFGIDSNIRYPNVFFVEPLDYLPFVFLMNYSYLILTDSGGIQEEAPGLGKPVLVMRDTTERPEGIEAGTAKLVGTDKIRITSEVSRLLNDANQYEKMSKAHNPYGDGCASGRIVDFLKTAKI